MFGDLKHNIDALMALLVTPTWGRAREVIETRSDVLLTDRFDASFDLFTMPLRSSPETAALLQEHRRLLQRCRTEGVATVFSELPDDGEKPRLRKSHMGVLDSDIKNIATKIGISPQALAPWAEQFIGALQQVPGVPRLMESFLNQIAKTVQSTDQPLVDAVDEVSQSNLALQAGLAQLLEDKHSQDSISVEPLFDLAKQTMDGKLIRYIAMPTWDESRAFLEKHPELLAVKIDADLQQYIQGATLRGDADQVKVFEEHRQLLQRCREVGIDQAYAELTVTDPDELLHLIGDFIGQPGWEERRQLVHAHPNILSDTTDDVLCQLIDRAQEQGRKRTVQTMTECRDLLRLCRENGTDAAFAELMGFLNEPARLIELLVQAETWEACGDLLREYPQLLEPDVDDLISRIIHDVESQRDKRALALLVRHREFLQHCREMGTDRALALYTGLDVPVPESFQNQVRAARNAERRFDRRQDRAALGEVMASWARIVAHADFNSASSGFKRACLRSLGTWQEYRLRSRWREAADCIHAIQTWQQVLAYTDVSSHDMPLVHKHLGELLLEAFEETQAQADIDVALDHFRAGRARCETNTPIYGQFLCGLAKSFYLRYKTAGQDIADLQAAINAYESALASDELTIEDQLTALTGLSLVFSERFTALGDAADLEQAIHYQDRADQIRR